MLNFKASAQHVGGQSQHLHQPRRSVDTSISQQPHATILMIADDTSAPAPAPLACNSTAQQAQQWQGSIAELVCYVGNMAQHAGRKAQQAEHSGVHVQLAQLQAQLQQQSAQLHSQAEELSVLRALLPGSSSPNGSRGNQLYQELQRRQQEADGWRSKYQLQLQCRDVAESALQETRVVVDQLFNDCAAVSGMLKNLQLIESASAATDAAPGSTARKASMRWLAAEVSLALLLVVCTGVATFLITRAQLQCNLPS